MHSSSWHRGSILTFSNSGPTHLRVTHAARPVGKSVWIAPNTTQTATATYVRIFTSASSLRRLTRRTSPFHLADALTHRPQLQSQVALIPLIKPPCNDPALAAGCLGIFRVCGSDGLPAPLCPSVCDKCVVLT